MPARLSSSWARALVAVAALGLAATATAQPRPDEPKSPAPGDDPPWVSALEDAADRALLRGLLDPNEETRQAALRRLWETEGDRTARQRRMAPGLSAAFHDGDVPTRVAAARSLAQGGYDCGPALVRAFDDPVPEVRAAAARAVRDLATFSAVRYPESLPGLIRLLDDPDWRVRAAAPDGVQVYGGTNNGREAEEQGQAALPRIIALASDEHVEVRLAALGALWGMRYWHVRAKVDAAFEKALVDPDPRVRSSAAAHFASEAHHRRDAAETEPFPPSVLNSLHALLADPDVGPRRSAMFALWYAEGRSEGLVPILAERVQSREGIVGSTHILVELGPEAQAAVPALISVLGVDTSDHFTAGGQAIDALFAIGPDPDVALPLLGAALTDEDRARRRDAAEAVGTLDGGADRGAALLERALATERDPWVRGAIWEALGRLGGSVDSLPGRLVKAIEAEDGEAYGALRGLTHLGARAAPVADALERLLSETRYYRKALAVRAFASVATPLRAARALATVGSDPFQREELARALEALGPADAALVPELVRLLPSAPSEICRALARIGPSARDALPRIEAYVAGARSRGRIDAAEAVLRIGGPAEEARRILEDELLIRTGENGGWATEAALALGRLGEAGRPSLPALTRRAEGEDNDTDKMAVWVAIWRITGEMPKALANVERSWIQNRHDSDLVRALGEMGPAAAPAVVLLEQFAHRWQQADRGREEDEDISCQAVVALGKVGPPARAALPTLRRMRHNALFRAAATEAIRRIEGS